ncbi:MAG TPA: hypothetical protein VM695_14715, partial [Phycisphaerae bacterium]|nr:hypothetical protein [Phycisphaerae bacterium]
LTPGEGGGANRSFVEICMKASPENTRRLLALQEELEPRGYRLDPEHTHVWSLVGDPNARAKAREMAPEVLAAAAKAIRTALPKAQTNPERPGRETYLAGIRYEIPGTTTRGMIWITEITATKRWELPVDSEQAIHLPRLGLMVKTYYRPGRDTTKDALPERAAVRKAVHEAVAPLRKLEGDTARRRERPLPPAARPSPAPATQPAAEAEGIKAARLHVQAYRLNLPAGDIEKLKKSLAESPKPFPQFGPDLQRLGLVSFVGSMNLDVQSGAGAGQTAGKIFSIRRQTPYGPLMVATEGQLEVSLAGVKINSGTPPAGHMTIEVALTGLREASTRGTALPAETISPFRCRYDGRVVLGQPVQVFTQVGADKCVYLVWLRLRAPGTAARTRAAPAPATQPAGIEGNPRIRRNGNVITLAQDANDADLAALRDVKGIAELRMGGGPVGAAGPYITDAGLASLSGWTDLKVLYLPGLPVHDRLRYPNVTHFTDAGLAHLRGLTKLEKLVLLDQEITDEGLADLSGLTELRELWLDFIPLSDAGLEHLSALRKLQVLRLYGARITDNGLGHLAGMTDMRDLQLGRAGVTDKGLAAVIGKMHKLETLDLQGDPVSDDGLPALANLTNLRWLALHNTPITDAGLKQVARLHKLEYLFLDGTDITDAGLAELAGLKQLKRLKLEKTAVTAEGVRKLKLSLPGLEAVMSAQGATPPATRPAAKAAKGLAARIVRLIAQLGSEEHAEREAAQKALVAIGRPALRALEAAGGDKDPERAARAQAALRQIKERLALKKETWRNRWESMSLSFRLSDPSGRIKSMALDVDPRGKAVAELWEPRQKASVRYESVLARQELDTLARRLGMARPWELNDAPRLPLAGEGTIALAITVEQESVHVEQPWPPPKGQPLPREGEQLVVALMAIQNEMAHRIEMVRHDAAVRAAGGAAARGAEEKEAPPPDGDGERTALRKVLDLLDLPWQTKLSAGQLDEAAASIRGQADQAVEAILTRYNATNNNSFRHRAVQVFQRLGTAKAQAALLDIALGRT